MRSRDFMDSCRGGVPLPRALRRFSERWVGVDLQDVRVSVSRQVETFGVAAVALGERIAVHPSCWRGFDDQRSLHLLFHELTHVAQQRAGRVAGHGGGIVVVDLLESEAELLADRAVRALALSSPEPPRLVARVATVPGWFQRIALQAHPGSAIVRRALLWLEKRGAKAISKHIAEHATRNFGKAIHSVFRSIDKIRPLIRKTLEEAAVLTEDFAKSSGAEAIEKDGLKITRQATRTPGKVRWLIQKDFGKEIGTKGETVLRVVLDMSGRIVTAFPADKILTVLVTAAAAEALTEGIADAAEKVSTEATRVEQIKERKRGQIDMWDFVPYIGEIWGGSLNEFEDLDLDFDRFVARTVSAVVADAEERAGCSFVNHAEIEDLVRCGLGLPILLENPS
jgi:hypothetical protein